MESKAVCDGNWEVSIESLGARKEKVGKWFLVHENAMSSIECVDSVDIKSEFFALHPNNDAETQGIRAIKLDDQLLEKYQERIRVCSYRWRKVAGIGPESKYSAPGNYGWFFKALREGQYIGWMDFCSNIGVNVDYRETMKYMGSLYANNPVMGDWLMSVDNLESAITRGWIFQEMAFGPLCADSLQVFFGNIRKLGKSLVGGNKKAIKAYISAITQVSALLSRRGYPTASASSPLLSKLRSRDEDDDDDDDSSSSSSNDDNDGDLNVFWVPKGCDKRQASYYQTEFWDDIYSDQSYFHPVCIFAMKDEDEYKQHVEELVRVVSRPLHLTLRTVSDFFSLFDESLVMAILECELTYERDRLVAVTSVAKAILERLGEEFTNEKVILRAWKSIRSKMLSGAFEFLGANYVHAPKSSLGFALGLGFEGTAVSLAGRGRKCKLRYTTAAGSECVLPVASAFGVIFDLSGLEEDEGTFWHDDFKCECKAYLCTDKEDKLMAVIGLDKKTGAPRSFVVASRKEFGDEFELPAKDVSFC